ncbi:hypothetical protein HPB50_001290 [Hyalomma asiaticum]|uniref:Uncharacterized protein n=1 Tax=Hyalomma asiaticum TaxID=266040 RepID=A0ACB7RSI9_HYAAI|nr:hypothetical protein HPB50_001290 [Hyalomma asiaticum]
MESIEAMAMMCGYVIYNDRPTYLRGYNIVPGAVLERCGEYVYLTFLMGIDIGELDDIVRWPFNHLIKCRFVHESTGEEYALICKPSRKSLLCQKPTGLGEGALLFPDSVALETLKSGGYIQDDRLRVVLELL